MGTAFQLVDTVENSVTPTPRAADEWVLKQEWKIGGASEAGAYEFTEIPALASDHEGKVFVLEGLSQEIRVFSSSGDHESTFGGRGGRVTGQFSGARLNWLALRLHDWQ